ncbi:MAG: DUF4258 domain-containing protein [Proteobacteria bacterium]|nr:DUF4258 domain-containing protein [Pseudomonadota bacterium]
MFSARFNRPVRITHHATRRMAERGMSEALLLDLIETGTVRHKDNEHAWVWREYAGRSDNLLCAAILIGPALIVKTVMHHFMPE